MSQKWREEVFLKWKDRQSAKKNGNVTEIDYTFKDFFGQVLKCVTPSSFNACYRVEGGRLHKFSMQIFICL